MSWSSLCTFACFYRLTEWHLRHLVPQFSCQPQNRLGRCWAPPFYATVLWGYESFSVKIVVLVRSEIKIDGTLWPTVDQCDQTMTAQMYLWAYSFVLFVFFDWESTEMSTNLCVYWVLLRLLLEAGRLRNIWCSVTDWATQHKQFAVFSCWHKTQAAASFQRSKINSLMVYLCSTRHTIWWKFP